MIIDYVLTGCGGFVAAHYLEQLAQQKFGGVVLGVGTSPPVKMPSGVDFRFEKLNMLEPENLSALLKETTPRFCVQRSSAKSKFLSLYLLLNEKLDYGEA